LGRKLERDPESARAAIARVQEQLDSGLSELLDLARGIHPTVLTDRGLEAALAALARRAAVPVELHAAVLNDSTGLGHAGGAETRRSACLSTWLERPERRSARPAQASQTGYGKAPQSRSYGGIATLCEGS
jgi:hypothetical protein